MLPSHKGDPAAQDERAAQGASPETNIAASSRKSADEAKTENAASQGLMAVSTRTEPNMNDAAMRTEMEQVPAAHAKRAAEGGSADFSRIWNKFPRKESHAADVHGTADTSVWNK